MYAKVIDGQVAVCPYNIGELRRAGVVLPRNPSDAELALHGVYPLVSGERPEFDPITQKVKPQWAIFDGSKCIQTYAVEDLSPEEVAANTATAMAKLKQSIVDTTQKRLDDFAKTRGYDGILSACTYATSPNPKFRAEGQYGVEARDATWSKLYEILAEVEAGTRPMPSGYADIEPELPALVWPDEQ